ncbi:signal peptidase I [Thermococcus sp. CX2]|uniref:signal peptidase I n=1 Tax=Thermococcus sp. CX2 TaxID=163006 RepID=UPI00143C8A55|nr:signal peptidase I [Thermococcus sp. CX2]NJE85353.1 signal peptidase I [Thermococcus sp. CX2]
MRKKRLSDWISVFLLLFVLIIVVLKFIFGFQYVVVLTDSMEPTIKPNSLVITYPSKDIHVGDVILYEVQVGNSTYRILHRVVTINEDSYGRMYYLTKGDNRKRFDSWYVYPDQVIGKPLIVIPKVGVIWYYTPFLVLALLLVVIASLAYDFAWALIEEPLIRPKSKKADLLAIRKKKIKVHHYKRR